eukprot:gene13457-13583_t
MAIAGSTPARESAGVALDPVQNRLYMLGGSDKSGCATNTLYQLDLTAFPSSKWQLVDSSAAGAKPQPRFKHTCFIWQGMLYVYGGFGYDNSGQTQLHSLDLNTMVWSTVHQKGCVPDRTFVDNKQKSFQATVAADGVMLAFGRSVQSPRLAQMLQQAEVNPRKPLDCKWVLHLQDVYPDCLKLLLEYMYGCLQRIPIDAAPALFTASSRYGLPGLHAACLEVLVSSISFDTVTSYILLAHDQGSGELTQACVAYAAATFERFQQVVNTPGFLHLNQAHPQVGAMFVQMALQYMGVKAETHRGMK